jgi:hypothetical protein
MKAREAEFQARENLSLTCPSCGASFATVRGEDDLIAVGEYVCGARHMAFREAHKKACIRRCVRVPLSKSTDEESRVDQFVL